MTDKRKGTFKNVITNKTANKTLLGDMFLEDTVEEQIDGLTARSKTNLTLFNSALRNANPKMYQIIKDAETIDIARSDLYDYLNKQEQYLLSLEDDTHILEKVIRRDCIYAFRSILAPLNEKRTKNSTLRCLRRIIGMQESKITKEIHMGFIADVANLFKGISGNVNVYAELEDTKPFRDEFLDKKGREAAIVRTKKLDEIGANIDNYLTRYPSGLEDEVIQRRVENKKKIQKYYNASEEDWNDHVWQLRNVIKDASILTELINLPENRAEAIRTAVQARIPFGITPYYLSLMDADSIGDFDHAVRAQVIPPEDYLESMIEHSFDRSKEFDFMGENDTSPIDLVTRRYPCIAILKPFNTCAQICVYCQRNWEIDECMAPNAMASRNNVDKAIDWLAEHESIHEILVTGGDPAVMRTSQIKRIFTRLAQIPHIKRIRLGTRTPVVLPQRWTDDLIETLAEFHDPPNREIVIVTHFEHSYEITPDALEAVQKIRKAGMSMYNQAVFTIENSRRFELYKLRMDLKSIGIDPYYTFNMKGKKETRSYIVPIARVLQERKEEARLLPGLDRTDEPVFNVPRLGKNHLRAGQDHRLIQIKPDGSRIYSFHPWEKNITPVPSYNYTDVPIYDYLMELAHRGEDLDDYKTIWFYF